MSRYISRMLIIAIFLFTAGCFNLEIDKPLVDLGGSNDNYQVPKEHDPAPGVPYEELTREQQLQRDLTQCQQMLEIKEKKYDKLKDQREEEKDRYKDEIDKLEDRIEDLEEENRDLRKKVRERD